MFLNGRSNVISNHFSLEFLLGFAVLGGDDRKGLIPWKEVGRCCSTDFGAVRDEMRKYLGFIAAVRRITVKK